MHFGVFAHKNFYIIWLSNLLILIVPQIIPAKRRVHLIWYPRLYYYHWDDTSAGGLLVLEGIIPPVVSI